MNSNMPTIASLFKQPFYRPIAAFVIKPHRTVRKSRRANLTPKDLEMLPADLKVVAELLQSGRLDHREADAVERLALLADEAIDRPNVIRWQPRELREVEKTGAATAQENQ